MKEYYENEDRLHKNILNMPDQLLMLDNSELTPLQSNSIMAMLHNSQVDIQVHLKDKPLEYFFDHKFEIKVSDLKMFNDMKKTENLIMDNLHYIKDNVKILQNQAFQSFDTRSFSSFTIFPEIVMSMDEMDNMTLKYQLSTSLLKIIFNRKGYINSEGDYVDDKTLYTPIYLDILMDSGLTKKSEICLYKMLLCLGIKFNNHPTLSIYYPIDEFKKIVGVPLYKTGKALKDNIDELFYKVSPHINFTPVYELKLGKGNKYIGINIKCAYQDFKKDMLYLTYTNKTKEYEYRIDETNKKLFESIEKENKTTTTKEDIPKKKIEIVETKIEEPIMTQREFKEQIRKSKFEYVHYDVEGSRELLKDIIECSNKSGIIKLIVETKDYNVYYDKFSKNSEQKYENCIVTEEFFKKGYRLRKIKEEITDEQIANML